MGPGQIVRFVVCLGAAYFFYTAGAEMSGLRSVGGESVAEFFYQSMGQFSYGMALLSVGVGITSLAGVARPVVAKTPTPAAPTLAPET